MPNSALPTDPIAMLPFSAAFKRQCGLMGFGQLEDILMLSPAELISRPGFDYHWLGELSDFLSQRGLGHLLQPIPGRSSE